MKKIFTTAVLTFTLAAASQDTALNTGTPDSHPFTFNGYVEAYYAYDFNQPGHNQRPDFLYSHNRHNEFNINLAYVKGSYQAERVRANLVFAAGTYMNANYTAEPGVFKNIYEANAGYKLLAGKNLWLDIGIMPSHIGFESAHSPSCWTLTRSIMAENSPYFESGARLSYATDNGKLSLSALALNGWQRITRVEGNSLMSWGTQVNFVPSDLVTLNYSTFLGTDKPDSVRTWRYFHNIYGIFQLTSVVGLIVGFDYGQEQKAKASGNKSTWYTPVGILRLTPTERWSFALRGEYYSDKNNVIIPYGTPHGFKTTGISANADYWPMKNVAMRMEGRTLHSRDAIFSKDGSARKRNTSLTFSVAIVF